jgi:hypothetical protein
LKNIFKVIVLFIVLFSSAIAEDKKNEVVQETDAQKMVLLQKELSDINDGLLNNIWITRYNNYLTYRKLEKELEKIKTDAKKYAGW